MEENIENINIEIKLFLEAIFQKYGYDFRNYSLAHIKRRILHRLSVSHIESISIMQDRVLRDPDFLQQILLDFSINVTEMFRDPDFYMAIRKEVIPVLKTYPFIKIWHAGCATGEEVFSMAILLQEEGLLDKTQIYATDFNQRVLKHAKEGIYSVENVKEYTQNYLRAGGKESFSDYYTAHYDRVIMNKNLSENVLFAHHNLPITLLNHKIDKQIDEILADIGRLGIVINYQVFAVFWINFAGSIVPFLNKELLDASRLSHAPDGFEPKCLLTPTNCLF